MKRSLMLICVFVAATAVLCIGCTDGNVNASPSPAITPMTSPSALVGNSPAAATPDSDSSGLTSPGMNASPNVSASPGENSTGGVTGGGAGGSITGFEEGKSVDISTLPDIEAAIKAKYAEATIKSVAYATYLNEQLYLVTLEGAGEGADKVYVSSDGTIIPYDVTGGSDSSGGSGGSSGSGSSGGGSSGT